MLLPRDVLSGTYKAPRCFLCETNKEKIAKLDPIGLKGSFKFNSYSELSFDVARIYNDMITGANQVNPYYDKIEAFRLVFLEGFGYFELQDPEIDGDGIKEVKSLTAYSLEYTLSQKYLENFRVNTGEVDSIEVMYAEEHGEKGVTPITLYNEKNPKLSLLHLILEKAYGWKIGTVDASLKKLSRQFDIDRESIYDFIMNEICPKFNCYAIFDTVNNTINFYAESLTNRFMGDGTTKILEISPVFSQIGTVSVDGYKTIDYKYNLITGELTLGTAPLSGQIVEVTDGALSDWETDVFVTFDNLAQQMNISYSSDDVKTVLTVKGANDLDIREVNNGLPYIVDLSYFYNVGWMGQELYDKYTDYLKLCNDSQVDYKKNAQDILKLSSNISYEMNRLSLQYAQSTVNSETVGTYYVRGGEGPNYYYTEVKLPGAWKADTTYYSLDGGSLNEDKVANLYGALQQYYYKRSRNMDGFTGSESTLMNQFAFMKDDINTLISKLNSVTDPNLIFEATETPVLTFLDKMWNEIGLTPLESLYLKSYKTKQTINVSAGWAAEANDNYGLYYPVVLIIQSIETAIAAREKTITPINNKLQEKVKANETIANSLLIANNFDEDELIRLNAFLREDEYVDDNFVETGNESPDELFRLKQELLECGRVELSKLCEPCLKFTMSLANIYALPEFAPIVNQFQLGKLIKVALRSDYIKHARLMQVDLNFEDFSDFSCEFGDLSSIRSQTDLHADLLSQAVSAGKTVAGSASYWDKGSDTATATDIKLAQGLLDATTAIKSIDGTQNVVIDKYGIKLQKVKDPDTGELDPHQAWLTNNMILMSSDGFKTAKAGLGEFEIDGKQFYGLLADAVIAGYIEGSYIKGSEIEGGTIKIGYIGKDENGNDQYNFEVDENGYITMRGGTDGNGNTVNYDTLNTTIELAANGTALSVNKQEITLTCHVYRYGKEVTDTYKQADFKWSRSTDDADADARWTPAKVNGNTITISASDVGDVAFFQCKVTLTNGDERFSSSIAITTDNANVNVHTSKPNSYNKGDLWVVGSDYQPYIYQDSIMTGTTQTLNASNLSSYFTYSDYPYTWNISNNPSGGINLTPNNIGIDSAIATIVFTATKALTNVTITGAYYTETGYDKIHLAVAGTTVLAGVSGNSYTAPRWSGNLEVDQTIILIYEKNDSGHNSNENLTCFTINCDTSNGSTNLNTGDWVTDNNGNNVTYSENTILVSTTSSTQYHEHESDKHWVESVYYSHTLGDLKEWQGQMKQYVQVRDDGLHLICPSPGGTTFESLLQSQGLRLKIIDESGDNHVAWFTTTDTEALNVTARNYVNVQPELDSNPPYIQLGSFKLQIEGNGSLSIV